MGKALVYPKLARNTVHRKNDRGKTSSDIVLYCFVLKFAGIYDLGTIHSIVNETPVCHVSFAPDPADPFPAILPMIAVMGSFDYPSASIDEPMDCYLHGYVSSRIMNLARASDQGLPVCIAATRVDGLVLSLTPNSHSYNYRSAILHGYGSIVEIVEEKLYAMQLITNSVVQNRWENTRTPPDAAEMQSTVILRVKIVSGSAKIRDGGPHDDRKDQGKNELTEKIWTGVVPLWETLGEPVPASLNRVEELPDHVTRHRAEVNRRNEEYAKRAAA
jgi:uncharacterized protein